MKNKKIGIVTCYMNNFGACLQAYALQETLRKNNYENELIRYTPIKSLVKYNIFIRIGLKVRLFLKSFKNVLYKFEFHRAFKFDKFRKQYIKFSKENYKKLDDLYKKVPNYDAFLVGSDQVWNPLIHNNQNNKAYFLDFVKDDRLKISYAPSLGVSDLPIELKNDMKTMLKSFSAISVRENTGKKIIDEISDIECRVVLDPTLLLDKTDWNKIAKNPISDKKYILCYIFSDFEYVEEFIKKASEELNLKIIVIPLHARKYNFEYDEALDIGPSEFVGLIRDASLVITDSFHATAFSLNLNVPFYSILRNKSNEKNNMNSRINDILKSTDLENRIINETSINNKLDLNVDFTKANDYINTKRQQDVQYLLDSINLK